MVRRTDEKRKQGRKRRGKQAAAAMISCLLLMGQAAGAAQQEGAAGETEGADSIRQKTESLTDVRPASLHFASDWEEIYQALKSAENEFYTDVIAYDGASDGTAAAEKSAGSAESAQVYRAQEKDYSSTNLREAQVDEPDIIKTDGLYLYCLQREGFLSIVRAAGAKSELISRIAVEEETDCTPVEMYVDGAVLTVICSRESSYTWNADSCLTERTQGFARVYTYDISDPASPVLKGTIQQEGGYRQSRKNGEEIYLYTEKTPVLGESAEDSELGVEILCSGSVFGPEEGAEGGEPKARIKESRLAPESFCIPRKVVNPDYLILSSFKAEDPSRVIDSKVFVSGGGQFYVSRDNIYILNESYHGQSAVTQIAKFAMREGQIAGVAACTLRGYVNDSFSIDEYQGSLRVLTTYTGSPADEFREALADLLGLSVYDADFRWVRHNRLVILDEELRQRSRLDGIAENEEVRAARYFGDTVYFVTYENTDPVFVADLSDPDKPRLQGHLKVSGFSAYLHPYGEGRLLGIGYETDEKTGDFLGLKLSMFDTSEPGQVKELDRLVLPGITWCPAIENYRAILADGGKNVIGFYYDDRYLVFGYEEGKGFTGEMVYDFFTDGLSGQSSEDTMRGLYIGDTLYLAGGSYVLGFDMTDGYRKDLVLSTASRESTD